MIIRTAAALAVALIPAAGFAQTGNAVASAARDVRCMLITTHMSKVVKDPKVTPLMSLASSFYLGRVDRAVPPGQLEAMMRTQAASITPANAADLAKSCAGYMIGRAEAVQRVGQSLKPTPQ